jgi:hypothetical protein
MRKPLVEIEEIIKAGKWLLEQGQIVTGYKLKKYIGKGRPERLMEVWINYLDENQQKNPYGIDGVNSANIHVLEPEIEFLLEKIVEGMNQQFKEIVISCDLKVQIMADKKVEVARKKFELEIEKAFSTLDVREEYIGDLEMENEKLSDELTKLKSIELNQFENEKIFIKLRGRLQSKSDLLAERQLRINELVKLNNILEETKNMPE